MTHYLSHDQAHERLNTLLVAASADMARGVRMGTGCDLHVHDEWVPLERHHIWPLGMGGPNVPGNLVTVCENGHGAIHAYIDLLVRYGDLTGPASDSADAVPYEIKRHFGPKVRQYARLGWRQAGKPRRPLAAAADADAQVAADPGQG